MAKPRPTLLTPKRVALIEQHLRAGLWRRNAAALVGVSDRTFQWWMQLGERELEDAAEQSQKTGRLPRLSKHAQFAARVLAVEAQTERKLVGVVVKIASGKGWQSDKKAALAAATWWLERRYSRTYGRGAMRIDLPDPNAAVAEEQEADAVAAVLEKLERVEGNVIRLQGVAGGSPGSS